MKKNKYNRRISAMKRLEDQIVTHRMSEEFFATLDGLSSKEKEDKIVAYWDRKSNELVLLKKKLALV